MEINGISREPIYQSSTGSRTKGQAKKDFSTEISAAAKQTEEMMQIIREKKEEILEKVKKGETEQSFQIGAASFTLKEWERFLEKFDKSEEEIKKLIEEAGEIKEKAAAAKEAEKEAGEN